MIKKFKILETNIGNQIKDLDFECETKIGTENTVVGLEETYRTFMFDGLRIKLVRDDQYIIGSLNG